MTTRTLTGHIVNPANDALVLMALDGPGPGGASHAYRIVGPMVEVEIHFQNGPIAENGVNGVTHEVLLEILIDRLRGFQAGPFASPENAAALTCLNGAQEWLQVRTRRRMAQGIEGTMKPDPLAEATAAQQADSRAQQAIARGETWPPLLPTDGADPDGTLAAIEAEARPSPFRWRKRPVEIEAIRFDGWHDRSDPRFDLNGAEGRPSWLNEALTEKAIYSTKAGLWVETSEGGLTASPGDWIIRGVKGELYPCKPDIFAATYDAA